MTLEGKRVLVTGSHGFLGRHLVRVLEEEHRAVVFGVLHSTNPETGAELTWPSHVHGLLENATREGPLDFVFHLAGFNGGIRFNELNPAGIFIDNTLMGLNLLKACAASGKVRKVVSVIASCAYAAGDGVCRPHELFGGPPHPTVACHAWAKRNIQLASDFCWRQHRLEAVCVCPPTLYGPGDTYHPERTKVVGALVRRFVDARRKGEGSVSVWGTGKASREVMYVLDAARLIALSTGWVCTNEPLNLAGGQEYTIADLAYEVMLAAGYRGELRFDPTRPDGQSRKKLQPSPASPRLEAYTALQEGLARAVADYEERFPCA